MFGKTEKSMSEKEFIACAIMSGESLTYCSEHGLGLWTWNQCHVGCNVKNGDMISNDFPKFQVYRVVGCEWRPVDV